MANGNKKPAYWNFRNRSCHPILYPDTFDLFRSQDFLGYGIPVNFYVFCILYPILHDLGSSHFISTNEHVYLWAEFGQIACFLRCSISATNNSNFFPLEEKAITNRTGRDAFIHQFLLRLHTQPFCGCTC